MKVITLLALIAFSNGTKLDRIYLPPNAKASAGSADILEAPVSNVVVVSNAERPIPEAEEVVRVGNIGQGFVQSPNLVEYKEVKYPGPRYQIVEQIPERAQAALERNAAVLRQDFKNDGETYAYAYETENGIYGEENGVAIDGVRANGAFSYIGDDGVQYSMSYTADENGFQPKGDHLPVPPPIPEEILRSLEQNARDEAAGIFDDGSYDERKYGGTDGQGLGIINVAEKYYNVVPTISSYVVNNKDTVVVSTSDYVSNFQNSGYKSPLFIDQKNNLVPALNNLVQEVTPSTVNKAYLPPAEVVLEDRSSESNEKPLFGSKIRQPNFNAKSGYKY